MGLPKNNRLNLRNDFYIIRNEGKRHMCPFFILQYRLIDPEEVSHSKLGIIATRKLGNAVIRNRGKRIIRKFFIDNINLLPCHVHLVVILKVGFQWEAVARLESDYKKGCQLISNKNI